MSMARKLRVVPLVVVVMLLGSPGAGAQEDGGTSPCSLPEARQFDFWIGQWDLTWGESGRGTNRITAVLDDCVIRENFDGTPSMPLKGWSVSTYDRKTEADLGG